MKYYMICILSIALLAISIIGSYNIRSIDHKLTKEQAIIIILQQEFNYLSLTNKQLRKDLLILRKEFKSTSSLIKVKVTYYCPWAKGINSDSNPNRTALMVKPVSGYTIAISNDLFDKGLLGKKVYVEGFGIGRLEDRMGNNITGDCIDICVGTCDQAIKLGVKRNITMIIL